MGIPLGLMIILALLAIGGCFDVALIVNGTAGVVFPILVLVGRVAAIVGILMRTRTGWFLSLGFFGAIIALNALATSSGASTATLVGTIVPAICAIYLVSKRSEFT